MRRRANLLGIQVSLSERAQQRTGHSALRGAWWEAQRDTPPKVSCHETWPADAESTRHRECPSMPARLETMAGARSSTGRAVDLLARCWPHNCGECDASSPRATHASPRALAQPPNEHRESEGDRQKEKLTLANSVRFRIFERCSSRSARSVGSSVEWSETVVGTAKESAGDGEVADDDGVAMRCV